MTGAEVAGPPEWLQTLFLGLLAIGFVVLAVWGFTMRRLAIRVQDKHPAYRDELRSKSRRRTARLAVVSELQALLIQGDLPPPEVTSDPVVARLIEREAAARKLFLPLALAAFATYLVGPYF